LIYGSISIIYQNKKNQQLVFGGAALFYSPVSGVLNQHQKTILVQYRFGTAIVHPKDLGLVPDNNTFMWYSIGIDIRTDPCKK
jgi:hypothetical protein